MASRRHLETSGADMDLLMSYMDGFRAIMAISAACELELFDEVNQTRGGATAEGLAKRKDWDEDATLRLLNACVALKILTKQFDPREKEVYNLAGPGKYLLKNANPVESVYAGTTPMVKKVFASMSKIPAEVRTGKNKSLPFPPQVTVHKSLPDPQSSVGEKSKGEGRNEGHGHVHCHGNVQNPKALLARFGSMGAALNPYLEDLLKAFDLSRYKSAVDLGAGSGVLSLALRRIYPSMRVTFFDVPAVTQMAEEYLMPKTDANLTFISGDFFEVELPKADLFILSKVLHDWNPAQAATLLSRIYSSTTQDGAIILLEKCLNDAKDGPPSPHLWDLMVMCACGGRQRSGTEYKHLLLAAGYTDVQIRFTVNDCAYDVIFATKNC